MRWKSRNKAEWHDWFAWYPVHLEDTGEWAWLEFVYRKRGTWLEVYLHRSTLPPNPAKKESRGENLC